MKTSHALGIILVSALLTVGVGALQWTVGSAIGKDLCTHHLSEMSLEQRVACNLFYGVEQVRGPRHGVTLITEDRSYGAAGGKVDKVMVTNVYMACVPGVTVTFSAATIIRDSYFVDCELVFEGSADVRDSILERSKMDLTIGWSNDQNRFAFVNNLHISAWEHVHAHSTGPAAYSSFHDIDDIEIERNEEHVFDNMEPTSTPTVSKLSGVGPGKVLYENGGSYSVVGGEDARLKTDAVDPVEIAQGDIIYGNAGGNGTAWTSIPIGRECLQLTNPPSWGLCDATTKE